MAFPKAVIVFGRGEESENALPTPSMRIKSDTLLKNGSSANSASTLIELLELELELLELLDREELELEELERLELELLDSEELELLDASSAK